VIAAVLLAIWAAFAWHRPEAPRKRAWRQLYCHDAPRGTIKLVQLYHRVQGCRAAGWVLARLASADFVMTPRRFRLYSAERRILPQARGSQDDAIDRFVSHVAVSPADPGVRSVCMLRDGRM
jgi:hypothetical protein